MFTCESHSLRYDAPQFTTLFTQPNTTVSQQSLWIATASSNFQQTNVYTQRPNQHNIKTYKKAQIR